MLIKDILDPSRQFLLLAEADAGDAPGGMAAPAPEGEELDLTEETPAEGDDTDELEIGPEKYKVPKPIKEAWNGLQKSTQAEKEAIRLEKEAVAKERASFAESEKLRSAFMDELSEIRAIDKQLDPYLKLTPQEWIAWSEQDSEAAKKAQIAVQALQMQKSKIADSARAKAQELDGKARTEAEGRRQAAEREIAAKVKDWSPAKKEAAQKVAETYGFSKEVFENALMDPAIGPAAIAMLNDLGILQTARAKAAAAKAEAAKAAKDQEPIPEPSARIRAPSGNTTTIPRDSDPPDVWLKKRQAQVRRRGMA